MRVVKPAKEKVNTRSEAKKKIKAQAAKTGWKWTEKSRWKYILSKSFSQDRIEVEFLKTGSIKITVPGQISAPNHMAAENFMRLVTGELGGTTEIQHIHGAGAAHSHTHTHA
jgi:hypothetical protein